MNKKVFAIIVTYNGAEWIDKNISSLLNSSYPVSIIAIDNKSSDNSAALLERYPEVDLIKSPHNLGFGKGNNIGIEKALELGADYIFLLNQDAWVFGGTIGSLLTNMVHNSGFGIISPMHFNADEVTPDPGFANYIKHKTDETSGFVTVPFVNAAAWMVSRECVEAVGLFEPAFNHYGEDRNYCDRVQYHKFKIGVDRNSRIIHDRVIKRNFSKDVTQSQYKILCTLLNINHSPAVACLQAAKEVAGLPKYFLKYYGVAKSGKLFLLLLKYYLKQLGSLKKIRAIRETHKSNG